MDAALDDISEEKQGQFKGTFRLGYLNCDICALNFIVE